MLFEPFIAIVATLNSHQIDRTIAMSLVINHHLSKTVFLIVSLSCVLCVPVHPIVGQPGCDERPKNCEHVAVSQHLDPVLFESEIVSCNLLVGLDEHAVVLPFQDAPAGEGIIVVGLNPSLLPILRKLGLSPTAKIAVNGVHSYRHCR